MNVHADIEKEIYDRVWDSVWKSVWRSVDNSVSNSMLYSVYHIVDADMYISTRRAMRDSVRVYVEKKIKFNTKYYEYS